MAHSSSSSSSQYHPGVKRYQPLREAILKGDWEGVSRSLISDSASVTAKITETGWTPLELALNKAKARIARKLIELMSQEQLVNKSEDGFTALHVAAAVGNIQAAKLLYQKAPSLVNIRNSDGNLPLHFAAAFQHREMTSYLIKVTKDDLEAKLFLDESGVTLMGALLEAKFYDVALDLLQHNPKLAWDKRYCVLKVIAQDPSSFLSGTRLNIWQRLIYACTFVKLEAVSDDRSEEDLETRGKTIRKNKNIMSACQILHQVAWNTLEILVPGFKKIRCTKLMHYQSRQLVRYICSKIHEFNESDPFELLIEPFQFGVRYGIHEVVKEILKLGLSVDKLITYEDKESQVDSAFHVAVMYRREKIFNILCQHYGDKHHRVIISTTQDHNGDNILHLAGNIASQDLLDFVSDGVLQMQRELQWFKEVEKLVSHQHRNLKNNEGKTPLMILNEKHEKLVKSEGQWVQGMANSCTVAATLVASVVFAAAIQVPGGSKSDSGTPNFYRKRAFLIFAIADAISLFTSIASVLSFLSVLSSRYAVIDFLYSLPKRLIMGLVTLFISVTTMIIAFSASFYLIFGEGKEWVLISVAALACLPVTLFMLLQLPLLLNMIKSTYGPSIFHN